VPAETPDRDFQSTYLQHLLDRIQDGDAEARDDLIGACAQRLEALAGKMVRRFPRVRRWVETSDVVQNAVIRLLRALESTRPETTRGFFSLAATQVRRELLDLARHFYGPEGLGTHQDSLPPGDGGLAASRWTRPAFATIWNAGPPFMKRSSRCRCRNARWSA
jgi:hypothetical protein